MLLDPHIQWKRVHYNWPQRRSMIVRANREVAVMARGVGKTEGIIAPRIAHNAFAMRRSLGGMVTPSFNKLFSELIPSIYTGLDKLGYVEGKDYTIGTQGPAKWEKPYKRVKEWKHMIHWRSGSGRAIISQDRAGMGHGISVDDYIVDEGKLIDWDTFENSSMPAMRGNRQYFEGKPEFQSILIVSDMPVTKKERAFLKYGKEMDPVVITMILQGAHRQQVLAERVRAGKLSDGTAKRYVQEINSLQVEMDELRRIAVYYHEGNILDNIHVYGWERFLRDAREMDPIKFRTSLMNEKMDVVEGAWYSLDEQCFYKPQATDFLTARGPARELINDCRKDAEIVPDLALDLAMDYGGRFNCMAVGQLFDDLFRIDNGFHATHPKRTQDVVKAFLDYYRFHRMKYVNYYFDDTARDKHGTTEHTYHDIVIRTLQEGGWDVNPVYIGQTPSPKLRYELFTSITRQETTTVQWNPYNCADMITAMRYTQIKDGRNGIEKNKGPERGDLEDQVHAPHYGDAVDTLVWGRLQVAQSGFVLPSLFR